MRPVECEAQQMFTDSCCCYLGVSTEMVQNSCADLKMFQQCLYIVPVSSEHVIQHRHSTLDECVHKQTTILACTQTHQIKPNQITFNEDVTNVHACSEIGQMVRCSNVTEIKHKKHTKHRKNSYKNDNTTTVSNTGQILDES